MTLYRAGELDVVQLHGVGLAEAGTYECRRCGGDCHGCLKCGACGLSDHTTPDHPTAVTETIDETVDAVTPEPAVNVTPPSPRIGSLLGRSGNEGRRAPRRSRR